MSMKLSEFFSDKKQAVIIMQELQKYMQIEKPSLDDSLSDTSSIGRAPQAYEDQLRKYEESIRNQI